jgi:UDP-N-acetylglucosamine 2-epimerase
MVCYYSTPGFAMIKACKELNIPVIDIQHGIQGDHHYAYGSWEKYDLEGSESLLPDIFYLWSKDEAESIGKWKNNDIRVFIGGNDYLDMWRYGDINEISENIERLQEKYDLEKYKKIILYTLSGFDVVNQSIIEAINKSPKDWFWFIRMHPKRTDLIPFWREELKECNCDYAIKDIEKEPLYLLMKLSDIHLTERSSTVMEAEKFGLHSIVTEEESKGLFKQYIDSGNTVFANTPDQIKRYIVELDKEVLSIEDTREEKVDELINIIELTGK